MELVGTGDDQSSPLRLNASVSRVSAMSSR
jgi:hypothetical protein